MKTPLPLTKKGVTRNFIKKMLRAKHLLVLLAMSAGLLFNASKAFSQTTTNESFESGPQDATTFTSGGQIFNIGSNVSGPFVLDQLGGYGWNGTSADNWVLDNYSSSFGPSPSFFINSATTFKVNSFWVQLLADIPLPRLSGGTLVVSGTLAGNPVYTETFSSGFNTDISTNNGYTLIALTGTDAAKVVDKITISADNQILNIVLDAFNWTNTATTTVTSITNAGASPTNAASVDYTVTFGSAVTGLSASNFSLTTTGVTGAAVGTPTSADGGVTWTVPVTTGTGDGTIILNLANGAGLSQALTTTLPFVGSTYTIDKTPPTVVSINRVGASPNNAVTDQFTVTFSEAVTGVDITDFSLTNTGATTGTIASVTGSGTTYTVTVNTVAGDGTMRLDLNPSGTGITDAATNPIAGGFTTGQVYTIDQTAPTVTISAPSVTATVVGPVTYTVTYSDANFNTSTLTTGDITLNTTGTAAGTVGLTGSGLTYTVTISGISGSGTLGISIAAGTATDLAGNLAPAAGPSATFTVTPVTILSLTKTDPSPTNAASVSYTATFSSAVSGLTASNFSLTTTGTLAGTSVGTPTTADGGITWTIAVNTGTGDGNLTLNLANSAGVTPPITTTLPFAGDTYIIDKTAPAIAISAPSLAATVVGPVTYTVTYSDANFNTSTLTTGDITLNTTGTATGTVGVTGSGLTYTVTISGISGSGTLGISIAAGTATDLAGNLAAAAGPSGTFTVTPVTILSLTKTGPSPTNAASVSYTATFSSAVSGLTASNFSLTTTGTLAGTSVGIPTTTDGGITWTIAVNTGTGDGNLTLNLANTTGVTPPITSTLPFAGDTYIIDKTAPAIAISAPSVAATVVGPVTYTVTYSDANFNTSTLTTGDITLNTTGTATGTVGLTGSGLTYTVTISGISGSGTLGISIGAGTATDLAGNTAGAAGPSATFTVTPVTILSLTKTGPSPTNAASVSYTATFSSAVSGLTASNFSLTTTGTLAGTSVGTPTTADGGITWTIAVNTGTGDGNLTLNLANGTGVTPVITTTLPFAGDTYIIDKTAPAIVISAPSATSATTGPITYTVTYSDANFGTSALTAGNITLNTTGTATGTVGVTGSGTTYTVTISGISGTGTLGISIGAGTATDLAGNTAGAAGPSATFTVAPANTTIVSLTKTGASPTNAATVSYTATFGTAVTGLTAANFSLTTTGTLAGTSVGTPTTADGGLTWTVTVNTGTGDGNLTLNLANATSLTPGISTTLPFAGDTYVIDKTPPTVVSINTVGPTSNTASSEQFTVTFSEAVTGVDISDFSLVNTGSVLGTISGISGSGAVYTVTISSVSGNGTMKLNLKNSGTGIADIAGNPIATGFTAGQVYILGDATNAAITTLTIFPGTLTPAFDPATKAYTAEVTNATESVAVTVTAISGATIAINGTAVAQGSPEQVALNIGNNTINVVITAPDGTTTATYTIVVYRGEAITSIVATNILTPNGDGKNDVWVIKDIELYPNNIVTVYDKAGRVVYTKHGYLNDWGGTYNGTPLVQGTYYYTVDLGTYLRRFTGYISIVRN